MRKKILIVDDEELNRELLRQIFEGDYEILMARDGREALNLVNVYRNDIAAVLLDLVMPNVNGYQVLQAFNAEGDTQVIPVILITANTDIKIALSCYSIGAAEIINKPFVSAIVRQRVVNTIEMYASREYLRKQVNISEQKLSEKEKQLDEFNDKIVDAISEVIEFRDVESGQHIKRVKGLTQIMATSYARLYPEANLTRERIGMIVKAAALHDIGKIAIPDSILLKPGRLTDDEREVMKGHTTRGCDILAKLADVQEDDMYEVSYEIVRHHHERYDGRGYPDGLKGDEIPLSAAIVSVADVYDALTSERVYKKPYTKEKAFQMIVDGECGAFDPKLIRCLEYSKKVMELFVDSTAEKEI